MVGSRKVAAMETAETSDTKKCNYSIGNCCGFFSRLFRKPQTGILNDQLLTPSHKSTTPTVK